MHSRVAKPRKHQLELQPVFTQAQAQSSNMPGSSFLEHTLHAQERHATDVQREGAACVRASPVASLQS